ncbi:unnamed protein product [Prorocentrum cordatum]|uniref:Uncharacterized protein n=1 Tax=Prorocentrum cordatum TaxID=2364126 RepID=A0ABN9XGS5_9DINO|nr:unnamed protein product [Polarella glacialis]
MPDGSWLMGPGEAGKEPPRQKKAKQELGENQAMKRLVHHLETRMRTVEHQNAFQVYMPQDHTLVTRAKSLNQQYEERTKAAGSGRNLGPPELQIFGGIVSDIEHHLSQESCANQLKKYRAVFGRVLMRMQHSDAEETAVWVKEFSVNPCFDVGVMRVTVCLKGEVVVGGNAKKAAEVFEEQKAAWGGVAPDDSYEALLQRSPLEAIALKEGQKMCELQAVVFQVLRAWNGSAKAGRAPRGAFARRLLQKWWEE